MTEAVRLSYPFTGRWLVQNSPSDRLPSHGTTLFATTYAIDFVPVDVDGRSAPFRVSSLIRPEPPRRFPGFGRPVLSPAPGIVASVHDGEADHDAFRGLPSLGYAFTQRRRVTEGWSGLAGNHVVVQVAEGVLVALCHLQRGSITVVPGQSIEVGFPVGRCGNSGNSTEPHLHLQAMDRLDPRTAEAVPISFPQGVPWNGDVVSA